ncbi:MAG TPA: TIM barrel protein [Chloroflexota bacterium]
MVGYVPGDPARITPEVARTIHGHGYLGTTVRILAPLEADEAVLRQAGQTLRDGGVEVVQCNPQYEMLVDPDESRRRLGIRQLQAAARCARLLGADNTYIRPGSLSPLGAWRPYPGNNRLRTIETLVAALREVVKAGEQEGVPYAIEGAAVSPLDTPERVRDVLEAVDSSALGFNADPVNFVRSLDELYDNAALTNRLFDLCGRWVICAHVKDIDYVSQLTVRMEEVPLGDGAFDQVTFARRFDRVCPDGYFMLEHLEDEQYPRAKANLDRMLAEAGIAWSA